MNGPQLFRLIPLIHSLSRSFSLPGTPVSLGFSFRPQFPFPPIIYFPVYPSSPTFRLQCVCPLPVETHPHVIRTGKVRLWRVTFWGATQDFSHAVSNALKQGVTLVGAWIGMYLWAHTTLWHIHVSTGSGVCVFRRTCLRSAGTDLDG